MTVEVQWKKFVKPDNTENPEVDIPRRLHQMEESLSKTLTLFYFMAGRYVKDDGCFIDCNDVGVEFVHAKVEDQIDQLLHGDLEMDLLDLLPKFPTKVVGNPLVVIQVNTFECNGLAIGLRFTHKIGDMYTMVMFINSWATACRGNIDAIVCPSFELSSLFPVKGSVVLKWSQPRIGNEGYVMRRFRFSSNAISKLKALARDNAKDSMAYTSQPSRGQVVSALISRAFFSIDRNTHSGHRTFVVCTPINLREKVSLANTREFLWQSLRLTVCAVRST
ncbi:hypothetical protein EUGRSUZ_G00910 [Eucalyptus grandis]|uniref:Uncharacterized protein n=2 Tax=Eucalyptus grandis TaxID=71139 RepID=A0ACC3K2H8_EUCGR|nr:hypothetical protein EUGRSUZ_G00910 [Eucalyptus grandis]